MQFKVMTLSGCYQEIVIPVGRWNKAKAQEEILCTTHTSYRFYANETVVVLLLTAVGR